MSNWKQRALNAEAALEMIRKSAKEGIVPPDMTLAQWVVSMSTAALSGVGKAAPGADYDHEAGARVMNQWPACYCEEPGLGPRWCHIHRPPPVCWDCGGPLYGNRSHEVEVEREYASHDSMGTMIPPCTSRCARRVFLAGGAPMHTRRSLFRRMLGVAAAPSVMFVESEAGESPGNTAVSTERYCLSCKMQHFVYFEGDKVVVEEHHAPGCRYA